MVLEGTTDLLKPEPQSLKGWSIFLLSILLIILGLVVWLPSIGGKHFDDDYLFVFMGEKSLSPLSVFTQKSPTSSHYRPMEAAILILAQETFGVRKSAYVVQGLAMFCHIAASVFIFLGLMRLRLPRTCGLLASVLFVTHPTAASAVLGNDSTSQLHSGWLGLLGAWLIASSVGLIPAAEPGVAGSDSIRKGRFLLGLLTIVAAMLFKETAMGFLLVTGLLVLLAAYHNNIDWKSASLTLLMPAAALGGYMLLRRAMGLSMSTAGSTAVAIGMNIPRNLVQLFMASVTPVSSVQIYVATVEHAWLLLAGLALGPLLVGAALVYGLLGLTKEHSIRNIVVFAGSMLCVFFPAFMVSHVSELYAYAALPLVMGVIALAIRKTNRKPFVGQAIALVVIIIATVQVQAVWSKAKLMKQNGEASERLVGQLVEVVRKLPPNTTLYLQDIQGNQPTYSCYLERGFAPITDAARYIKHLANRPDVAIRFVRDKTVIPENSRGVIIVPLAPDRPIEGIRVISGPD
jgi:hypothetical protein